MKGRLLLANLMLVAMVLGLLELPLAVVYSRHEHDALNAALERDASSLAALSEEIVEHPTGHDVEAFARRFSAESGASLVIVDHFGRRLAPAQPVELEKAGADALRAAQAGRPSTGESGGSSYAAVPVGGSDNHGAVLIERPNNAVDGRVRRFWLLLVGIGVAVLAASVVVSARLARWAIDPLAQLERRAADLGRGALDVRANTSTGPPEVVALATTFNEMADRLDDLLRSQRRFVAEASHQLRSPLTALRLRLENLDADEPEAVIRTREAALLETSRLSRLVDGLLTLARAEGGRPERHQVDVGPVVAQRHEAWTPVAAEGGVTLVVDGLAGEPIAAMIVPGHLEQILDNLIDNALEATPRGKRVSITVGLEPGGVAVHVTDEGHGMSDEDRERAFDPFWQGGDRRHSGGGTGLGLAIVDQLVRASGGTVRLDRADAAELKSSSTAMTAAAGIDAVVTFPVAPRPLGAPSARRAARV